MFNGCSLLETIDVSNFDTTKVTNMNYMFNGCEKVTKLEVRDFKTENM